MQKEVTTFCKAYGFGSKNQEKKQNILRLSISCGKSFQALQKLPRIS